MNLKFLQGKEEIEFRIRFNTKELRRVKNSLKRARETLCQTSIRNPYFRDCVNDVKEYERTVRSLTDELAKLK